MKVPTPFSHSFSPYHDPEPWAEFYDDMAQRGAVAAAVAIVFHILLFLILQPSFRMPDIPEDPEAIPVQIIAYEPAPAEETLPPVPVNVAPKTPAPAVAPQVKPRPQPTPRRTPPPPQPEPILEPEPEPETIPDPIPEPVVEPEITPPESLPIQPDILASETPQPAETITPEMRPTPVEPQPIPELLPQPDPLQDIQPEPEPLPIPEVLPEILPDLIPDPILDPVIEPDPVTEPEPEPIVEPEPFPEIEIEAEPLLESPLPDIVEIQPDAEPEPVISEAIEIETPDPGLLSDPEDPQLPELETAPLPIEIFEPDPEPQSPPAPEPEIDITPEAEAPALITTAPTILASPDAAETIEELENAVPQSQADPMIDFRPGSARPPGGAPISGGQPNANIGGTPAGRVSSPGGSARSNPGAGGWTLAPKGGQDLGAGYGGLVQDVRCREDSRNHQDCPEYAPKYKGRNIAGFESFGAHSNGTVSAGSPRAGTQGNQSIGGGTNPWARGIGNNSVNAGGPSESVLDDADFGRTFLGTPLGDGSTSGGRVRDIFAGPTEPWNGGIKPLPVPVEPLAGLENDDEKKKDDK